MLNVLLPHDGSDYSLRALDFALKMGSREGGATFHLIHVHEEPRIYGKVALYEDRERVEMALKQQAGARLAEALKRLAAAGVSYTSAILEGSIAETIAAEADRLGCDLIVMGTRGHGPVGSRVLGSISNKVIHASSKPVLLVK